MYDDAEYARSRIEETLVRLDGEPVYVHQVTQELIARVTHPLRFDGVVSDVKLGDLTLESPKLGWVNTEGGAAYVSRIPKREDWRQGVRRNNLTTLTGRDIRGLDTRDIARCIKGTYPRLQDVVKQRGLVAWSREWAVENGLLHYKHYGVVGKLGGNVATLSGKYHYLYESLMEASDENNSGITPP